MPDVGGQANRGSKRAISPRKGKVQPSGDNSSTARNNAKATRPTRSQGLDPGEWRLNAKSAVNITLYDCSGAPLRPDLQEEIEQWAESVAKRESLVLNIALG